MVDTALSRSQWLLLVVASLGAYSAGIVWLAQVSSYPLWPYVGPRELPAYYAAWSRSEWETIFAPLAIVLLAMAAVLLLRPPGVPRWSLWLGFILQFCVVALTIVWWSPPAARIVAPAGGLNPAAYGLLVRTHWIRVVMVTANEILLVWMVRESLSLSPAGGLDQNQWLLFATEILAMYSVGNIWLVQLVCYRLWTHVGPTEFYRYHVAWWHSIWGVIFVPAGLAFAGAVMMMWIRPAGIGGRLLWTGLGLQIALYALTAAWWGPLMARLATPEDGLLPHNYRLLMTTHWLRVAIVTAYGVLTFVMLVKTVVAGGPIRDSWVGPRAPRVPGSVTIP